VADYFVKSWAGEIASPALSRDRNDILRLRSGWKVEVK